MLNAGIPVTKQTVDSVFGGIAVRLAQLMDDAAQANYWLAGTSDSDLTGLGYQAGDISALKDAAYAYGVLSQLYIGQTNLPAATDYRVSIRKLAGLGRSGSAA
jgi:hypothetical protein